MSGKDIDNLFRDKLNAARYQPSEDAWSKVSAKIHHPENNKKFYWGIAAGIAVFFSIGIVIGLQMGTQNTTPNAVAVVETETNKEYSHENGSLNEEQEEEKDAKLAISPNSDAPSQVVPDTKIKNSVPVQYQAVAASVKEGANSAKDENGLKAEVMLSLVEEPALSELDILSPDLKGDHSEITEIPLENIVASSGENITEEEVVQEEQRGSSLKKMLEIARDWKTDNNSWGALREAKNDLLDFGKRKNIGSDD